jgi:Lipase (class 3)
MSDRTCLKRHLLYASVETYHPNGPSYSSAPARWEGGRPHPVIAPDPVDPRKINFALVGRFREGIVVAFRGTLPPADLTPDAKWIVGISLLRLPTAFADLKNDLEGVPARAVVGDVALPGEVHKGFGDSLAALWPEVAAKVEELRRADPAARLYFTGHSKGGALANLAAVRARQAGQPATVKVVTFGAARAGNAEFVRAYVAAGIDGHHYEVAGDEVPRLAFGTEPVPVRHGVALVEAPEPPFPHNLALNGSWNLPRVLAAHVPYRDFGYDRHVYETGVGPEWF